MYACVICLNFIDLSKNGAMDACQSAYQTFCEQYLQQVAFLLCRKSLPKEMEIWQTSKMWPFSCFSLEKEIPCLPGNVLMIRSLFVGYLTSLQHASVS